MPSNTDRNSLTSWESAAYASLVEFRVLGPVEAFVDGRPVSLGGPKQRHVLALLLAGAGRPIEVDRLIDGVWGDTAPTGARGTLQTYVSNLRGEIGEIILWEGDTYRLTVDRDSVDALRFEDLVAAARREADPARTANQLREALALWHGRPYSDIEDVGVLRTHIAQLDEMRVAALEARVESDLACGLHLDLVGELEALAAEHPYRERFRAQHMLALYRSGRQAEALRAFQKTRTLLAEELGIDPSLMLQEIEQRILNHDATLELEPRVENRAFLFTDLEDSTILWELHPQTMGGSLQRHDEILQQAVAAFGGRIFKSTGDGFCAVFPTVAGAVAAAEQAQREMVEVDWGDTGPLKVRIAIDLGDVETRGDDFFGPPLNRCSRILASGHGGQILISSDAHRALIDDPTGHWQLKALGEYRFKGLGRPQSVYQHVITGMQSDFPPLRIDRLPALLPGVSFGRVVRGYELREQIGGGDFGLVYRAYQPSVGREVAVKVIRPEYVNQPAFVRRFEAEAQLVAQLEHSHVVSLYDYWRDPDGAYLVMRWMRGGSLRQALNRGPWNIEPATSLLAQVGSALSYAHRQGIVHRDLKPGNVLLDEDGNGYLSDFGIATRLTDPSETRRPLSSSPAYLAPEELEGRPLSNLSDIYALGLLTFELLTGQRPPLDSPLPLLRETQPRLTARVDEVIGKATADDPDLRFRSVDEYLAALSTALGVAGDRVVPELLLTPTRNPFKGLVAFKETDAADFYGREQVARDLVQAVGERRLVAVVGPSGIGKSSVIRAGLIPALRAGGLAGSRDWLITDMFPGSYPFEELEAALLRVAVDRPEGLFDDLARDERGLLRSIKRVLPADTEMVLIIDQFEELFTLTTDDQVRTTFLDALVTLLEDARSRVRVIVGLRADFFDRPLRYPRFGEVLSAGVFPLASPSREEVADAITRPAHNVGVQLEEGLLDEVVGDISDQPGALPLLQYALTELFAARTSDTLTVHGYRSAGGVVGAIPRKAEELLAQLDKDEQEVARQVFLRLVAVHAAAADTRRRVRASELRGMSIDASALERILDLFGAHRLLTFDRDPVSRGSTLEVAHEAMLTEWHRLRDWIDERREDLLLHRRLSEAVQEWEQSGRDPSYLLAGSRLDNFEAWAANTDLLLTDIERTYVSDSRKAASQRQTKRTRRRRGILGGFAGAAIVSMALAGVAFLNQQRAKDAAIEADQQRVIAAANANTAEQEAARAEEEAGRATRNEELARSRELAASAINVIDEDPELSVLLALQAADIAAPPVEAVSALHEALRNHRIVYSYPWPADLPNYGLQVGLSPDGRYAAITSWSSYLEVRDIQTDSQLLRIEFPFPNATTFGVPTFSSDGSLIYVESTWQPEEGAVVPDVPPPGIIGIHAWDVATGELVRSIEGNDFGPCFGGVLSIASSRAIVATLEQIEPDGTVVCHPFPTYSIWMVDLETGERRLITDQMNQGHSLGVLSADGRFVFWGGGPTPTRKMDLETGEVVLELEPEGGLWPTPQAVSPDGRMLLLGRDPLEVVDATTGAVVSEFFGHQGPASGNGFSEDGRTAFSAGFEDGTIRFWDPLTGLELDVLRTTTGIAGASFSATGSRVTVTGPDSIRVFERSPTLQGEVGAIDTCPGYVTASSLDIGGMRGAVVIHCYQEGEAVEDYLLGGGRMLLSGVAYVFDLATHEVENVLDDLNGLVVALSPDGERIALQQVTEDLLQDGIAVRGVASGEVLSTMEGLCRFDAKINPPRPGCFSPPETPFYFLPTGMAISPDGSMLAAHDGWESLSLGVWAADTGELLFNDGAPGERAPSRWGSVAWSSDGETLAASDGYELQLYATDTWELLQATLVPPAPEIIYSMSEDGRQVIGTGLFRNDIQIFDLDKQENTVLISAPHESQINDLAVSADGSIIASAGRDGFVRVWDAETGDLTHEIAFGDTQIQNVEFADNQHLWVTPQGGPVLLMTIATEELLQIARDRLTRGFTDVECSKYILDPCPDLATIRGS